jgi:UPF0755 protein
MAKNQRSAQRWAALVVGTTMLVLLVGLLVAGRSVWQYPDRPHRPGDRRTVSVVIARGMSSGTIARILAEKDLLDHPAWFRWYANERGDAQRIRAGKYTLSASMTPRQLLATLLAGAPEEEVTVTIPEGKNMLEVAALLEEAGVCSRSEAEKAMRDPQLLMQLAVPGETVEGYLFPDTYQFKPGTPVAKVLGRLVKRSREVYAALKAQHAAGVAALAKLYGFDDAQIVIMASLVEKETGRGEERPRIAGVFLNRLRLPTFKPHLLQTDPTIIYGCTVPREKSTACASFAGRIRRIHLDDPDNPYNTYTHEGLPPGPICNPGRAALEAVMASEQNQYLYFVSKHDGSHYFSKTRAEHEAAVDKYQRGHGGS